MSCFCNWSCPNLIKYFSHLESTLLPAKKARLMQGYLQSDCDWIDHFVPINITSFQSISHSQIDDGAAIMIAINYQNFNTDGRALSLEFRPEQTLPLSSLQNFLFSYRTKFVFRHRSRSVSCFCVLRSKVYFPSLHFQGDTARFFFVPQPLNSTLLLLRQQFNCTMKAHHKKELSS